MSASQVDSRETARLLEHAAAGDRQAFDRLFALHRTSLKRAISMRMDTRLKARLDPSDLVQETQMTAYKRLEDYLRRKPMPFRLWLRKTAQQQLCDAQRAHIGRHRRSLLREDGPLNRSSLLVARHLLNAQSSPSDKMQRRELQKQVASAVAGLRELDREIVTMRNVENLSFEEIAQVLEMQAAAVRQRYGRALLKLREKLAN